MFDKFVVMDIHGCTILQYNYRYDPGGCSSVMAFIQKGIYLQP